MKKLLLLITLIISTHLFAQQTSDNNILVDKQKVTSSITIITTYPNPFNVRTNISFKSTKQQTVVFTIQNLLGKTVFVEKISARKGKNIFTYTRNNLTKGMYLYSLKTGNEIVSKRMVIK
ncbi:Por secretion system C-terminal sorting domain-containing protein [Lutibacter oricola]|uniref:Por secretion system C-terminal sorting domain-containing protein n=1 Tax=Lutibacter oricola TaxID=762486 RepID=A0A1H2ZBT5_9FLAO|nr:T9SS type A sorting domain-containing protein [Lutibacter oricola]SDX14294.1 Por secretion system C-terminal sorting domain-containing protein [Lutibacter oricola]